MILEVEHLSFAYRPERPLFYDVSFAFEQGQVLSILGANGAGKSTLLNCIANLLLPQQGEIRLHGTPLSRLELREISRIIGYVPQSPSFSAGEPVSVLDLFSMCIGKGPAAFHVGRRLRETVMECLRNVHGESLIDKKIGSLSGGELQRVLLALALEPVPDILILDEPLSGVDAEGIHQLLTMLDEIRTKFDLSIFMVTHDFAMLSRYVDKVVLLKETVLTQGTPEQVLSSPEFRSVFHMAGGEE